MCDCLLTVFCQLGRGMKRDDRLFALIQVMRDGRLHTAAELAEITGVSVRTIWRDMGVMAATGLPVEGERGVGYILRAPLVLPPLMLTEGELEALVEGLRLQGSRAARGLLLKVATLLPQAGIDADS